MNECKKMIDAERSRMHASIHAALTEFTAVTGMRVASVDWTAAVSLGPNGNIISIAYHNMKSEVRM